MCRFVAALAVSAVLAQPLAAQDRDTLPELEALIPDSAVENPEDWARQGAQPPAAPADNQQPQPDTPLADLPLITVPWPEQLELPQLAPLAPETDIRFAEPEAPLPSLRQGQEVRVSSELMLVFPTEAAQFPERDAFVDRFKQLSTIERYDDNGSAARLAAQARQDEQLLERMLRVYGYYDALVLRNVSGGENAEGAATRPSVRFDILPGKQYAFGFDRHRVGHQPAVRTKRARGGIEHIGMTAATNEDRIRDRQTGERFRSGRFDDLQSGHAEGSGIAADARGAVFAALDRDSAHGGIGEHPFDRNRA